MYNIKAQLSDTNRYVYFHELFEGTRNAFLKLIDNKIPNEARGKFTYGTIYGGVMIKNMEGKNVMSFPQGGYWNFATLNKDLMFNVYEGISKNNLFAFGMGIDAIDIIYSKFEDGWNNVACRPGIALFRSGMDRSDPASMLTLQENGNEFLETLEENTRRKLLFVDPYINVDDLRIRRVDEWQYKKKNAFFGGTSHLFTEGAFSIYASKRAMDILTCIGLGDLSDFGFGYITKLGALRPINDQMNPPSY